MRQTVLFMSGRGAPAGPAPATVRLQSTTNLKSMKLVVLLGAVLLPIVAHAQVIVGPARAVDGDTLDMTGQRIRLHGIDAPEAEQTCDRSGTVWACGTDATAHLRQLVSGNSMECVQKETDAYQRIVATCRVGQLDLGLLLIDAGLAVALANAPR